jgi:hypothetical protein
VPLVVKWADTEKERQARKAQRAQLQLSNMPNAGPMQQSSLFGALQMGYMPQYSGFGYQVSCSILLTSFAFHMPYNRNALYDISSTLIQIHLFFLVKAHF